MTAITHPSGRSVIETAEGTFVQVGWSTRPGGRWRFNQMWEVGPKAGAEPVYHFVPKDNGSRPPIDVFLPCDLCGKPMSEHGALAECYPPGSGSDGVQS